MAPSMKSEEGSNEIYETKVYQPQKSTWSDQLRGLFCINVSKSQQRKLWRMRKKHQQPKTLEGHENSLSYSSWPSPWILPVNVVSPRRDADNHSITKIAKCTIDTGNMQGNIVSREFAENVLGFSAASFEKLTKEEERGGTGITGDSHIPQGIIHLTWYHKNSTRVFRDMRFLVSPTPHCDLIIGARSIQKENILSVPCLMAGGITFVNKPGAPKDETKRVLENVLRDKTEELQTKVGQKNEFDWGGKKDTRNRLPALKASIPPLQDEVDLLTWTMEVYNIVHYPVNAAASIAEKQNLADPIWEKLRNKWVSPEMEELKLRELWKSLREDLEYDVVTIPSIGSPYATGAAP